MAGRTRSRGAVPSEVKLARVQVLNGFNHYDTLGVAPAASDADIKIAFRALASLLHPDRSGRYLEDAHDLMSKVNQAYACLSDVSARKRYDLVNKTETQSCEKCEGRGVVGKNKGFSARKVFVECTQCGGSGRIQPEQD